MEGVGIGLTVSEYIYDFLSNKAVNTVFMVSGSSAMWLVDALARETRYKVICNNHEQASAMSAEVYARMTGNPAICLVTVGPGATNSITGVAGAYMDSAPMIVLSGQASTGMLKLTQSAGVRQMGTQSLSLDEMVRPITKYFAAVMNEADIKYHLERAYHEATTGRPGPVWLDIPVDIQNKQIPEHMNGFIPDKLPEQDFVDLKSVSKWLSNAKRPLFLAGQGVRLSGAVDKLIQFVEKHQIPVITSRLGIDVIPTEHSLYVGRPGAYGDRPSHYAIQNCDVLLCIGSRTAVSCVGYNGKAIASNAKKIVVDIDKAEAYKDYIPMDAHFVCDAGLFLDKLNAELKTPLDTNQWIERCCAWRDKYSIIQPEYREETPINSYYAIERFSNAAPDNAAVIVDTGTVCNVASQTWRIKDNQRYIISGGFSCMGYWAGAIGAAASGTNTVIALTGDGSFQMNVQELATIAYNKLPIKLFVFENGGYLLIRLNQHNYMNDRYLGVGPDSGVGLPNIAAVASAYGLKTVEISYPGEFDTKLCEVYACPGPVVCVVHTKCFQEMAPRMASKVMPDGSLKASDYEDLCPFLPDDEHKGNMNNGGQS